MRSRRDAVACSRRAQNRSWIDFSPAAIFHCSPQRQGTWAQSGHTALLRKGLCCKTRRLDLASWRHASDPSGRVASLDCGQMNRARAPSNLLPQRLMLGRHFLMLPSPLATITRASQACLSCAVHFTVGRLCNAATVSRSHSTPALQATTVACCSPTYSTAALSLSRCTGRGLLSAAAAPRRWRPSAKVPWRAERYRATAAAAVRARGDAA